MAAALMTDASDPRSHSQRNSAFPPGDTPATTGPR